MQVATATGVYIFPLFTSRDQVNSAELTDALAALQPLLGAPDVYKCCVGGAVDEMLQGQGQLQLRCTPGSNLIVSCIQHCPCIHVACGIGLRATQL